MAPGGCYDDAVIANKEKGFYNHFVNAIAKEGPICCIWEVRAGISSKEFHEFIDDPYGPGFGLDALMKNCKLIDTSLINGQTPYPIVYS